MTESLVLVAAHGPVRVLTLKRPEAGHALSRDLIRATYAALTQADADESVRVVVLTGADPAFCAGVDLKEAQRDGLKYFEEFRSQSCIAAVAKMRTPIVGAINGATFTGGLEMALGCDFLIASERAVFADTHARVGIMPGWGLSQKLSRLIGIYRAKELSLTGNFLDAATAADWGLVNRVVPAADLMPTAMKLAADMASIPVETLSFYKGLIDDGFALSFREGLETEHSRSSAHNRDVTPQAVEARRAQVQARGRGQ
jgi:enoyl-CoA hydratase